MNLKWFYIIFMIFNKVEMWNEWIFKLKFWNITKIGNIWNWLKSELLVKQIKIKLSHIWEFELKCIKLKFNARNLKLNIAI